MTYKRANVQSPSGCTLEEYSDAKKLPLKFLKDLRLSTVHVNEAKAVRIPYFDQSGRLISAHLRIHVDASSGLLNAFKWKKGMKPNVYGLWKLKEYETDGIILVEGESDAHTLWLYSYPAVAIPGYYEWDESWSSCLAKFESIVVVSNAQNEAIVNKWLTNSKIRDRVYLLDLGESIDPSHLYLQDTENFKTRFDELNQIKSIRWNDLIEKRKSDKKARLSKQCIVISSSNDILDNLVDTLANGGVVGEKKNIKLIYLSLTSRLWKQPVSLAIKGQSSAGKTFLVQQVLKFFPQSAFSAFTAMSEKAVVYSEESFKHKFIVLYETTGLGDHALSIIRSLLSEGHIKYQTTETKQDGFYPRYIEIEGPSGLITTTTNLRLFHDDETRLLSTWIDESEKQTRAIFKATRRRRKNTIDYSPWIAFQEWLESTSMSVDIPYENILFDLMPTNLLRFRRDIDKILTLIEVHAFIHQENREKNEKMEIIAHLDDYQIIRELIGDIITDEILISDDPDIMKIVQAVEEIVSTGKESATNREIAERLSMEESAVSRKVGLAIKQGLVINLDPNPGRPSKLVINKDLRVELPTVDEIKRRM